MQGAVRVEAANCLQAFIHAARALMTHEIIVSASQYGVLRDLCTEVLRGAVILSNSKICLLCKGKGGNIRRTVPLLFGGRTSALDKAAGLTTSREKTQRTGVLPELPAHITCET